VSCGTFVGDGEAARECRIRIVVSPQTLRSPVGEWKPSRWTVWLTEPFVEFSSGITLRCTEPVEMASKSDAIVG
jgi:hypothetical protein